MTIEGPYSALRQYLPKIARSELRLQAFGVTEPGAGTDTTAITTTAVRHGDHYLVNGDKVFILRVQHSDIMTFGVYGFAVDFDVQRKFRETRLYQVAQISTNLIHWYIGERVLGLPRSY